MHIQVSCIKASAGNTAGPYRGLHSWGKSLAYLQQLLQATRWLTCNFWNSLLVHACLPLADNAKDLIISKAKKNILLLVCKEVLNIRLISSVLAGRAQTSDNFGFCWIRIRPFSSTWTKRLACALACEFIGRGDQRQAVFVCWPKWTFENNIAGL